MKTLLIDSSYLLFRSHFAYPHLTYGGKPTGAFYGYIKGVLRFIKEYKPDNVVIAKDLPEPTWRHQLLDSYKAGRPAPDPDMIAQIPFIDDWVKLVFPNTFAVSGFEADDIIFTTALQSQYGHRHNNKTHQEVKLTDFTQTESTQEILIFSSDKDLYQTFVVPGVSFIEQKGSNLNLLSRELFEEKYNLTPIQWIDYKALVGDSSDNLKGVEGIGPKTAVSLLQKTSSLYDLLAVINLPNQDFLRSAVPQSAESKTRLLEFLNDPKSSKIIDKIKKDYDQLKSTYHLASLQIVPNLHMQQAEYSVQNGLKLLESFGFQSLIKDTQTLSQPKDLQETLF
jgi:DNA polymerase-1